AGSRCSTARSASSRSSSRRRARRRRSSRRPRRAARSCACCGRCASRSRTRSSTCWGAAREARAGGERMVIHDRGYARWRGDRSRPVAAVTVILRTGLRRSLAILFRRKLPAIGLLLGAYGMFVFALGFLIFKHYVLLNADTLPAQLAEFMRSDEV